jgi:hypothetical protein
MIPKLSPQYQQKRSLLPIMLGLLGFSVADKAARHYEYFNQVINVPCGFINQS